MNKSELEEIGAVIVAAGRGERAGSNVHGPKQYRRIANRAVLARTVEAFLQHDRIGPVAIVIHRDDHKRFATAMEDLNVPRSYIVVEGGADRQASVRYGLEALESAGIGSVLIHDGVRPFVSRSVIDRIIDALDSGSDGALPALEVADTLKRRDNEGFVEKTVERANLYRAQTPQGFDFEQILNAHRSAASDAMFAFTDDSAIAEWSEMKVKLVAGDPENIKLTFPEDIDLADRKLSSAMHSGHWLPDIRTGNGYDVHALVPGDGVILCGVEIPHDRALAGHSDADVALHAITDALLATCGMGDIGDHFPPSDPQWKDAASYLFLKHAVELVTSAGGTIMNADVTLICEAPKIGPHKQAMRENLARIIGIGMDRCSVKATTNEKIGFVGRQEGIAAIATATVAYGAGKHE
ncbi:MAG: bifunctional 2-C-methyl-D-erythritol 4-phosphate cytidylyltransferase/2-C-methyl-D-erythritol 2,4-cyclodiphosphate synthase [Pseudomonadota bacterium]